ncbi:MAG: response regulator [Candidatus Komeilibacteria bacterium]|jgi:DNA-binding response OmpR family regulator|nr:response regulator [Candidatus Komeilibacteria bacterium]MBT4447156.1 response regulator [Candidatus Komeilibacteria bacterium]
MAGLIKKILVAEDEKPMAKALVLKLNHAGFEAKAAFNGEEAIEEMAKNDYDLLLLDMIMPRMDGFTVLKKLKEQGTKTKIVVTSNLGQEEDFNKAKELGATDYFVKSDTSLSEIVDYIKKM